MVGQVAADVGGLSSATFPVSLDGRRNARVRDQVWAMTGLNLRLLPVRPAGQLAASAAVLAGVCWAVAPAGLAGLPHGLGLVGGLAQGGRAANAVCPLILAGLLVGLVGRPGGASVAEASELAGQSRGVRMIADTIAVCAFSLMCAVPAVLSATIVGAGDALRQGDGWISAPPASWEPAGAAALAVVGIETLGLVLAVMRRRSAAAVLGGLLAAFLVCIYLVFQTGNHIAELAATNSPFGPFWSALSGPDLPWSLSASRRHRNVVVGVWLTLAVAAICWRVRREWQAGHNTTALPASRVRRAGSTHLHEPS